MSQCVLEQLVGREFDFYGVNNESFALDSEVYTALEDPDDGYRSYLGSVVEEHCLMTLVFPRHRLARVLLEVSPEEGVSCYRLTDVDTGHVWLEFGTNVWDSYYPMFVFRYTPVLAEPDL